ncbi:hypothetical protein BV898_14692 [Hypsibius exemplaris]|uniref:Uncharacterized protein n=1 Tax=Hypsibius exemplaris TaxID=2072580 RepID=A0A9X6RJQ7_HYPEX|nr:hypothetical protein BV898_14692 [Hypsibius exemplaris]
MPANMAFSFQNARDWASIARSRRGSSAARERPTTASHERLLGLQSSVEENVASVNSNDTAQIRHFLLYKGAIVSPPGLLYTPVAVRCAAPYALLPQLI